MARVAYVTAEVDFLDPDPDFDLEPTVDALRAAGLEVESPFWDDAAVEWECFDLVLVRSTWNYAARRDEFVAWVDHVADVSRVLNPADVIRTNTDKVYLERFIDAGLPVIPTQVLRPGQDIDWSAPELAAASRVVVKPTIGAGAIGASLNESRQAAEAAVADQHARGATVLVQPYVAAVDTHGEVAIIVIDGQISHAIKKVPALTVGGHGDPLEATPIVAGHREAVARVAALVPEWDDLLYARVDVVPDEAGDWALMELELTEPALFFTHDAQATDRFVAAVLKRLED